MFSSKDLFFTPAAGGYTVSKSLRFRASASAYLSRTFGTPTDAKKWTWSGWLKRGQLSNYNVIFGAVSGTTTGLLFSTVSDNDCIGFAYGGNWRRGSQIYRRDASSWYHIVMVFDSTNATEQNRALLYVNGSQQTWATSTAIALNDTTNWNASSVSGTIGQNLSALGGSYFDGYLAEVNFIDGQALAPSSFGAYDTNGIWQPITPSVSDYGKNGFYLSFADTTSTTTLGNDTAAIATNHSAANNWSTSGFSLTSGASYDSMLDSPTNAAGDIGNYCTFNPLVNSSTTTVSGGNLNYTASTGYDAVCTQAPNYKCYFEMTVIAASGTTPVIGMGDVTVYNPWVNNASSVNGAFGTRSTGVVFVNGVNGSTYSTYTTNNVVGFAFDPSNGKFWYSVNGIWANSGDPDAGTGNVGTATVGLNYVPLAYAATSNGVNANFGQRPFAYPPSSTNKNSTFSAINTQNLSTPTITNGAQYMAAVTYTGSASTQSVTATSTNSGNNPNAVTFQPDLVWVKDRTNAQSHKLTDAVRGTTKAISTDSTAAEATDANGVTAFNNNGFSLGTGTRAYSDSNLDSYVAWQWKEGVSQGFDIVSYAGDNTSNRNISHNLGVAPDFVWVKSLSTGSFYIWHRSLSGNTSFLKCNSTDGTNAQTTTNTPWGTGNWSSTQFMVTNNATNNLNASSTNYIGYLWTAISGFSSFGIYTGNGSADGVFVYTGMRPRWVMFKRTDTTSVWTVIDTSRDTYNVASNRLYPNLANAEDTDTVIDSLSNGFKIRTTGTYVNASAGTYIYAAFAENPFKISRAR